MTWFETVLPAVNSFFYLGGALAAIVRALYAGLPRSRPFILVYTILIVVWAWIGVGYLMYALGVVDQLGLSRVNRPIVWLTSTPAWFGFFAIDRVRDRKMQEQSREIDALMRRLDDLEQS